jgi:hypothetical protein
MIDLAVVFGFLGIVMAPCLVALHVSKDDRPYEQEMLDLPQA